MSAFSTARVRQSMLYLKAFHIIFVVTWFAGLFYLPRLFVYHAMSSDAVSIERFKVMERKLFWGIMTPSAVLAVGLGLWLWFGYGYSGGWLHLKVALVVLLVAVSRLDAGRRCWTSSTIATRAATSSTAG